MGFKDGLASMTLYVGNRTGQRVELRVRYVGTGAASGLEAGAGEQDGLELTAPSGVTVAARDVRAIVLELRRPLSMPKIDGFLVVSALAGPTELLSVPINEAGAAEASGAFVGFGQKQASITTTAWLGAYLLSMRLAPTHRLLSRPALWRDVDDGRRSWRRRARDASRRPKRSQCGSHDRTDKGDEDEPAGGCRRLHTVTPYLAEHGSRDRRRPDRDYLDPLLIEADGRLAPAEKQFPGYWGQSRPTKPVPALHWSSYGLKTADVRASIATQVTAMTARFARWKRIEAAYVTLTNALARLKDPRLPVHRDGESVLDLVQGEPLDDVETRTRESAMATFAVIVGLYADVARRWKAAVERHGRDWETKHRSLDPAKIYQAAPSLVDKNAGARGRAQARLPPSPAAARRPGVSTR
ncbi:hypothetical protein BH18ACT13_BH18ACT13_18200 [soil metagenome]